jgi:peptide chain release factor-like protein
MDNYRTLSDEQLLAQCRFEAFRGPGPGGQKRNKTSSSVRLTHESTGISALAGESRSQQVNRNSALKRLRHRMALQIRLDWKPKALDLDLSRRSAEYPGRMGEVLDALAANDWSVSETAKDIGATTGRVIRFLHGDEQVLAYVNQWRRERGLKALG